MGNNYSTPPCYPFPFFDLPALVQWQILRQHVSFSEKVTVLGKMPEFRCLMDPETPCWFHSSTCLLMPALQALSPGLYVRSDDALPQFGYYVKMRGVNCISFICCYILPPRLELYMRSHRETEELKFNESTLSIRDFLRFFLSQYVLADHQPILAYYNYDHSILVNRCRNLVLWDDRSVHEMIQSGECSIKLEDGSEYCLNVDLDGTRAIVEGEKDILESQSLKECAEIQYGVPHIFHKIAQCTFDITDSYSVAVFMKIYNVVYYKNVKESHYPLTLWFRELEHFKIRRCWYDTDSDDDEFDDD